MQGHAGGVIIIDVTPLIWLYPGTCFQLLYTLPVGSYHIFYCISNKLYFILALPMVLIT